MGLRQNYTKPKAANRYKDAIDQLIKAGKGAAWDITAPTKAVEGTRGSIATEKVLFQEAARDAGYTARETERTEADGQTTLVFMLTEKVERQAGEPEAPATPKA